MIFHVGFVKPAFIFNRPVLVYHNLDLILVDLSIIFSRTSESQEIRNIRSSQTIRQVVNKPPSLIKLISM